MRICTLLWIVILAGCSQTDELHDWDHDGVPDSEDCAPQDPYAHPGAVEDCVDSIDNDCDTGVDCHDDDCSHHPDCDSDVDPDDDTGDDDVVADDDSAVGDDDDTGDDDTAQSVALIVLDSTALDDTIGGDGDGVMEAGEALTLHVLVRNDGDQSTTGPITGALSLDTGASTAAAGVLSSSTAYNDGQPIAPGEIVDHDPAYSFSVAEEAEAGQVLVFIVVVADDAGRVWDLQTEALTIDE